MPRIVNGRTFGLVNDVINLLASVTATAYGVGRRFAAAGKKAFRGHYRDRHVRGIALAMLGDAIVANDCLRGVDLVLRGTLRDRPVLLMFCGKGPQLKEGFREQGTTRFPEARLLIVEGEHHFPMTDEMPGRDAQPTIARNSGAGLWDSCGPLPAATVLAGGLAPASCGAVP